MTAELTRLRPGRHPNTPDKDSLRSGGHSDAPDKDPPRSGGHSDVSGKGSPRSGRHSGDSDESPLRTGRRSAGPGKGGERPADASAAGVSRWDEHRGALDGRLPASLALSGPGEHIVVQPLGGGARPRGFFAVGAEHTFSPVAHTVINAAGSLLTLAVEQGGAQRAAELRVHTAVLELLLAGAQEQARAALEPLGRRLPEEPFVALATPAEAVESLPTHAFAAPLGPGPSAGGPALSGGCGALVVALVAERVADEVAEAVDGPVGVSLPAGYTELRAALDQAGRALETAVRGRPGGGASRGGISNGGSSNGGSSNGGSSKGGVSRGADEAGGVVKFGELAGQGLLGLLDPDAAQAFSAALLAPLTRYGSRADLVESLRAYLESNGHWDAAAQRLGVHRHTLRYRMKRVGDLLGRDLDDPGARAELWLALEATRRR
ncbi:helix-turn-helix domain-containing protein [Nonomuraea sp. B12E4]|uniref:PucR family transcriptional regulator n=1 Tax=Nonomuraea sp. B12E4 TaxID=3153564 RepID=UPI00325FAEC3